MNVFWTFNRAYVEIKTVIDIPWKEIKKILFFNTYGF